MTQARLTVTLPEHIWIGDVSRHHPDAIFKIMTAVPDSGAAFAVLKLLTDDPEPLLESIRTHEEITELSIIQQTDEEVTVQVETVSPPLLHLSAQASGMPIEFPVTITDGEATVDVTGSHERLSELASQLGNFDLDFSIDYIQERLHTSQLLSDKQQELVLTAVELGYYDTPRDCTLTELAGEAGIAKSTCSETLHRAEETMIKHFIDEIPTPAESARRVTAPN